VFYHSGPHICIAFNIGLQQDPNSENYDPITLFSQLCFLTSMANCANSLPNCVLPTHYTDVLYTEPKKTLSIFWHGNGLYPSFFHAEDDPDGERVQKERIGIKPLSLFVNFVPVTYMIVRNGVTKPQQTIFAVATIIPAPGVNVLSALEFIANDGNNKPYGKERHGYWSSLRNYVVPPQTQNAGESSKTVRLISKP
jgi:hypothetical protein